MRLFYLFFGWIFAFGVWADYGLSPLTQKTDLRRLGDANAPITLYIFSSFTCPHCAQFHKNVLPVLKQNFVETKRAKLVFVEAPFDKYALTASLLSRCVSPEKWEEFSALLYKMQFTWKTSPSAKKLLADYAGKMGLSQEDFDTCLADSTLNRRLVRQRDNMLNLYNVRSLPSVVFEKEGKATLFLGTDKELISKLNAQDI